MAVSEKPMFTAADTAGAPQFENGVWLMLAENERDTCLVDTAQPASKWPQCADWVIHGDGRWFERGGDSGSAIEPVPGSILVAGGDVAILQIAFDDEPKDGPSYSFAAFDNKPAATAKLRSIKFWIVMCGTYRASADGASAEQLVRYTGFDEKCRPASPQAIRDAAEASRPPASKMLELRWVRATPD